MATVLDAQQRAAFDEDGYVIVRSFFDEEETGLLRAAMETDPAISDTLVTVFTGWPHERLAWLIPWRICSVVRCITTIPNSQPKTPGRVAHGNGIRIMATGTTMDAFTH